MNNRIIFSDNGSLIDWSVKLNNYFTGHHTFTLNHSEDYIYIGSRLPFNHQYFNLSKFNTNTSVISVQYWEGNEWIECVEVVDETEGFKKSGFIQFTPNKRYSWCMESTNYESDIVEGLEDVVIYDRYWVRLKFSATLTETKIDWVGNIFCSDDDIYSEYPDLAKQEVLTSFKSGKCNWEEQRVKASER